MTNPCSPRFTGFIRDVRSPRRHLQQTLSQVDFLVRSPARLSRRHRHRSFHPSRPKPRRRARPTSVPRCRATTHRRPQRLMPARDVRRKQRTICSRRTRTSNHRCPFSPPTRSKDDELTTRRSQRSTERRLCRFSDSNWRNSRRPTNICSRSISN